MKGGVGVEKDHVMINSASGRLESTHTIPLSLSSANPEDIMFYTSVPAPTPTQVLSDKTLPCISQSEQALPWPLSLHQCSVQLDGLRGNCQYVFLRAAGAWVPPYPQLSDCGPALILLWGGRGWTCRTAA